jgi:hypothetical protein
MAGTVLPSKRSSLGYPVKPKLSCATGAWSVAPPHCAAIASATPVYVRLRSFQRFGPGDIM